MFKFKKTEERKILKNSPIKTMYTDVILIIEELFLDRQYIYPEALQTALNRVNLCIVGLKKEENLKGEIAEYRDGAVYLLENTYKILSDFNGKMERFIRTYKLDKQDPLERIEKYVDMYNMYLSVKSAADNFISDLKKLSTKTIKSKKFLKSALYKSTELRENLISLHSKVIFQYRKEKDEKRAKFEAAKAAKRREEVKNRYATVVSTLEGIFLDNKYTDLQVLQNTLQFLHENMIEIAKRETLGYSNARVNLLNRIYIVLYDFRAALERSAIKSNISQGNFTEQINDLIYNKKADRVLKKTISNLVFDLRRANTEVTPDKKLIKKISYNLDKVNKELTLLYNTIVHKHIINLNEKLAKPKIRRDNEKFQKIDFEYTDAISVLEEMFSKGRYLDPIALKNTLNRLEKTINYLKNTQHGEEIVEYSTLMGDLLQDTYIALSDFHAKIEQLICDIGDDGKILLSQASAYARENIAIYQLVDKAAKNLVVNLREANIKSLSRENIVKNHLNKCKNINLNLTLLYEKIAFKFKAAYEIDQMRKNMEVESRAQRCHQNIMQTIDMVSCAKNIFDPKLIEKCSSFLRSDIYIMRSIQNSSIKLNYPSNFFEHLLVSMAHVQSLMDTQHNAVDDIVKTENCDLDKYKRVIGRCSKNNPALWLKIQIASKDLNLTLKDILANFSEGEGILQRLNFLCSSLSSALSDFCQKIREEQITENAFFSEKKSKDSRVIDDTFNTDAFTIDINRQNHSEQINNSRENISYDNLPKRCQLPYKSHVM